MPRIHSLSWLTCDKNGRSWSFCKPGNVKIVFATYPNIYLDGQRMSTSVSGICNNALFMPFFLVSFFGGTDLHF